MAREMAAWAKEKVEEQWGTSAPGRGGAHSRAPGPEYLNTMPPQRLGVDVGVEEVVAVLPPARTAAARPARCPLPFPSRSVAHRRYRNTWHDAVSLATAVTSVLGSQ
jgi:hypothetical protein